MKSPLFKEWKDYPSLSTCSSAVREKMAQSSEYGIAIFHVRPSMTFLNKIIKTGGLFGLAVRHFGLTSLFEGLLKAVKFDYFLSWELIGTPGKLVT